MMATVPHVISGLGLRKFQADGFFLTRVYVNIICLLSGKREVVQGCKKCVSQLIDCAALALVQKCDTD